MRDRVGHTLPSLSAIIVTLSSDCDYHLTPGHVHRTIQEFQILNQELQDSLWVSLTGTCRWDCSSSHQVIFSSFQLLSNDMHLSFAFLHTLRLKRLYIIFLRQTRLQLRDSQYGLQRATHAWSEMGQFRIGWLELNLGHKLQGGKNFVVFLHVTIFVSTLQSLWLQRRRILI